MRGQSDQPVIVVAGFVVQRNTDRHEIVPFNQLFGSG
jgi:hypothetical protein